MNDREDKTYEFINVTIDDGGVSIDLNRMLKGVTDTQKVFEDFHARMITRIDRTFELAGAPGSVEKGGLDPFRDIKWEPLAAQSKRKDGTLIPAWGGVDRKDGKGVVKGRKRSSGSRIQRGDALNQDSGRFRQRAATGFVSITRDRLIFGPNLNYTNWVEEIRPAVFIAESDADLFMSVLKKHLFGTPIDDGAGR